MNTIITLTQIAQHLNLRLGLIKEVRKFYNCYLVIFETGNHLRPRFVTLKAVIESRQWSEADKLLVNKWVSARLVNIPVNAIQNTFILSNNQIVIEAINKTCYFLNLSDYHHEFIESRKGRVKNLLAFPQDNNGSYHVVNTENNHLYDVTLTKEHQNCTCPDYQKQQKAFGKGCCKHLYRTLQTLGYGSLRNYLTA
jgi:hypothetical protein